MNEQPRATPVGTYWVEPGRFLAGPYPAVSPSSSFDRPLLQDLLAAGITRFYDLTEAGELTAYRDQIETLTARSKQPVVWQRYGITDFGLPAPEDLELLLADIKSALEDGQTVYLHCHWGCGRTGTVVGCWLVDRGVHPDEVFDKISHLRGNLGGNCPETPAQRAQIMEWAERNNSHSKSMNTFR